MAIPIATKDNEWLGFCPCAVKLQQGDRKGALRKQTNYTDSYSSSGINLYYCAQKGCSFQSHVSVDFVWKVAMKTEELGVRWAFLAKSHIPQSGTTGKTYTYQCPICVYEYGHADGRTWRGTDIYLDHVSTHRSRDISPEVLAKLNIINDRIADDKTNFDLNLWPELALERTLTNSNENVTPALSRQSTHMSTLDKVWGRKQSTIAGAERGGEYGPAGGLARSETSSTLSLRRGRVDSMLETAAIKAEMEASDEPWSAGLSDFDHRDKEAYYLTNDF